MILFYQKSMFFYVFEKAQQTSSEVKGKQMEKNRKRNTRTSGSMRADPLSLSLTQT